jgi:L-malate glycosyltransferase
MNREHAPQAPGRRLNIAIVAPSMGILGGQAVQAARLLRAWGDDPDVHAWLVPINPVPPGPLKHALNIKYIRTIATQLVYWPLLVRELARADVVHVFSASYFSFLLAPLPAVIVARLLGKPVVMNYRSGEAPDHLERSAIARAVLRAVDRNAVPSRFLQEVFASFGIAADIVPNIIDTDRFQFRMRDPLRPRILSTRNFQGLYNIACTLRAFATVQARYPDASLTLVGAGPEERALRALAADLGLRHVEFAGSVPPEEIWRYYADADIYLQTPDIDNMPSSVLEAFASGCIVVSTNAGGVPAILANDVHGVLVPCGAHEAAAAAILRVLENPGLARRLAEQARASCDRYTWSSVRGQWLSLYRGIVPRAGMPAPTET